MHQRTRSELVAELAPLLDQIRDAEPIEASTLIEHAQILLARALDQCVREMRSHGTSWATIGAMFGTTRQAAWARFATHLEDRHESGSAHADS